MDTAVHYGHRDHRSPAKKFKSAPVKLPARGRMITKCATCWVKARPLAVEVSLRDIRDNCPRATGKEKNRFFLASEQRSQAVGPLAAGLRFARISGLSSWLAAGDVLSARFRKHQDRIKNATGLVETRDRSFSLAEPDLGAAVD